MVKEHLAIHQQCANESRPLLPSMLLVILSWLRSKSKATPLPALLLSLPIANVVPTKLLNLLGFMPSIGSAQPTAHFAQVPGSRSLSTSSALLPCTTINLPPNFRYLKHYHVLLIDPLRNLFHTKIYNNMWFPSSLPTSHPPIFKFRDVAYTDAFNAAAPFPFPLPAALVPAVPLSIFFPLMALLSPLSGLLAMPLLLLSFFCPITSSLSPILLLAPVGLVGILYKLICLDPSPLHLLAVLPAGVTNVISLTFILPILLSLACLAVDGFSGILSLLLLLTASMAPTFFLSLTLPSASLDHYPSFAGPSSNPPDRTSSFHQLPSFHLWAPLLRFLVVSPVASVCLSFLLLLLLPSVGLALCYPPLNLPSLLFLAAHTLRLLSAHYCCFPLL